MNLKTTITAAVIACTFQAAFAESEFIKNGDFSAKGVKPWKIYASKDMAKPTVNVAEGAVTITSAQASKAMSHERMSQPVNGLKSSTKYKLSFDAKAADTQADLLVTLARSKDWSKGHYGIFKKLKLTNDWKTHTIYFTTKQLEEGHGPQLKFLFGLLKGEMSFRNVKIVETKKPKGKKTP
jgi:hypothetical protein